MHTPDRQLLILAADLPSYSLGSSLGVLVGEAYHIIHGRVPDTFVPPMLAIKQHRTARTNHNHC